MTRELTTCTTRHSPSAQLTMLLLLVSSDPCHLRFILGRPFVRLCVPLECSLCILRPAGPFPHILRYRIPLIVLCYAYGFVPSPLLRPPLSTPNITTTPSFFHLRFACSCPVTHSSDKPASHRRVLAQKPYGPRLFIPLPNNTTSTCTTNQCLSPRVLRISPPPSSPCSPQPAKCL